MSRRALTRAGFIALIITSGLLAGAGPAAAQIACTEAALRAAIDGAAEGATITLPANCIITLTGAADDDSNISGDIDIAGNTAAATLTIQGAGVGSTIIDANGVDRGIDIGAGKTVTIKSLTLRGGDATQNAGTQDGGGIFFGGDSLTLQDVEIINNKANNGGGLFDFGGAITLTRVVFSGNTATVDGGGAYFDLIDDTATNVTFSGNHATTGDGGGVFHIGDTLTLTSVTIASNTADFAGGIEILGTALNATNTIVAGNSAPTNPDCDGDFNSVDKVLITNTTGCSATTGTLTVTNPNLLPLANNGGFTRTHAIVSGSAAENAGDGAACTGAAATDQRGAARVGTCDIGAFELTQPNLALSVNQVSYKAGDTLTVGATVFNNFGVPVTVDAYLGFQTPAGTVPGCAAANFVFVNGAGGLVPVCGIGSPSTFPKFAAGFTIPTMGAPVSGALTSQLVPAGLPVGTYTAFLVLTIPNAFADNVIGPGDVIVTVTVLFVVP